MDYIFSAASLFSIYTSLTAIVTLFGQFYSRFVPQQLHDYIASKLEGWFKNPFPKDSFTLVINQLDGDHNAYNLLYKACEAYISDRLRASATRLNGSYMNLQEPVSYQIAQGEEFVETLENAEIKLLWKSVSRGTKGEEGHFGHNKSFELSFNLAYKNEVLDVHIPLVVVKYYNDMTAAKRNLTLFTYMARSSQWRPVPFNHPFTFDTLAIDPALKQAVLDDLDKFIRRKDFYKKVGKAWKRGYLLYGPPGTGKSSLIAAMANYLRFDIYDLQLGGLQNDAILRTLMLSTKNKSILVIEDIDCTIGFSRTQSKDSTIGPPKLSRRNFGFDMGDLDFDGCKVTPDIYYQANEETAKVNMKADTKLSLSGLLNFIDGLWSSCGDERIVVFTTNHKDSLDPALLRPGRMDMHIHMSYLRMHGFRILVNNYLGVAGEHFLFKEIEQLLDIANVTPAQVAEELIRSEDADIALSGVVDMLKKSLKQSRKKKVKAKNNKVVMKANKDHSVSQGDSKESGEQEDSENEEVEHSQKKEVKAKSNKAVKGNKDHSVSLGDSEESGEQEDSEDEEVDLGVHGQSTG